MKQSNVIQVQGKKDVPSFINNILLLSQKKFSYFCMPLYFRVLWNNCENQHWWFVFLFISICCQWWTSPNSVCYREDYVKGCLVVLDKPSQPNLNCLLSHYLFNLSLKCPVSVHVDMKADYSKWMLLK